MNRDGVLQFELIVFESKCINCSKTFASHACIPFHIECYILPHTKQMWSGMDAIDAAVALTYNTIMIKIFKKHFGDYFRSQFYFFTFFSKMTTLSYICPTFSQRCAGQPGIFAALEW